LKIKTKRKQKNKKAIQFEDMEVTIVALLIKTPNSSPVCGTWITLIPVPQFVHGINQTLFDV
jgi:hypothetical protein